jgi:hypothetical protein
MFYILSIFIINFIELNQQVYKQNSAHPLILTKFSSIIMMKYFFILLIYYNKLSIIHL